MEMIAYQLSVGNPFAFLLIFMLLYPPILFIIMDIVDKFKKK